MVLFFCASCCDQQQQQCIALTWGPTLLCRCRWVRLGSVHAPGQDCGAATKAATKLCASGSCVTNHGSCDLIEGGAWAKVVVLSFCQPATAAPDLCGWGGIRGLSVVGLVKICTLFLLCHSSGRRGVGVFLFASVLCRVEATVGEA